MSLKNGNVLFRAVTRRPQSSACQGQTTLASTFSSPEDPWSYLPIFAEKILQICRSGSRRKSTDPEISTTTAPTYFKRKAWSETPDSPEPEPGRLKASQTTLFPTSPRCQLGQEGPPPALTQPLQMRTRPTRAGSNATYESESGLLEP